jgi:hypothetical protein
VERAGAGKFAERRSLTDDFRARGEHRLNRHVLVAIRYGGCVGVLAIVASRFGELLASEAAGREIECESEVMKGRRSS